MASSTSSRTIGAALPPSEPPPARPSDGELLAAAGSAQYSRLLIRRQLDRVAVAVVDTNGDGVLLVVVTFHLDDDGVWRETGDVGAGIAGQSRASGTGYAYGHAPGTSAVEIGYRGEAQEVPVDENGWWLYLVETDDGEGLDLSRVPVPDWARRSRSRPSGPPRIAG